VLSRNSPVLKVMLESGLKESVVHGIEWDDIDIQTFVGFWQFLYTGAYDSPTASPPKEPSNTEPQDAPSMPPSQEPEDFEVYDPVPEPAAEPAADSWFHPELSRTKKKCKRCGSKHVVSYTEICPFQKAPAAVEVVEVRLKTQLWDNFRSMSIADIPSSAPEESEPFEVESHGDVFKYHARVFILAERYNVAALMKLSFSRLHQALLDFNLSTTSRSDVVDLLHFCYDEPTPPMLREMVAHYAACKAKELWACEGFGDLVEASGEFSRALLQHLMQRID
jgi:hypothetical protein